MRVTIFIVLCAIASSAAAAEADRMRASATAEVSVSVPVMASVEVRASASQVNLSIFETGSNAVVLRYGASQHGGVVRTALRARQEADAVAVGSGRWTAISDSFRAVPRRASTGVKQSESDVTYEIWQF